MGLRNPVPHFSSTYPNTRSSQSRDVNNTNKTGNSIGSTSQVPDEAINNTQSVDNSNSLGDQTLEETNAANNTKIGNCEKIILKYAKELALTRAKIFSSIKKREEQIKELKEIQKGDKNIPLHFLRATSIKGLPRDDSAYTTVAFELIKKRISDLESKKEMLTKEYQENIRRKHKSLSEDWRDMLSTYPDTGLDYEFPSEAYFMRMIAEREFAIIHEFREREKLHVANRESKKNAFHADKRAKEEELADLSNMELRKLITKTANQVFQKRQGERRPKNTPPAKKHGVQKKDFKKNIGEEEPKYRKGKKKQTKKGKEKGKGNPKKLD